VRKQTFSGPVWTGRLEAHSGVTACLKWRAEELAYFETSPRVLCQESISMLTDYTANYTLVHCGLSMMPCLFLERTF